MGPAQGCPVQASWLTPSEIFTPYYGQSIANFILDKHSQMAKPDTPLRIFEIGGTPVCHIAPSDGLLKDEMLHCPSPCRLVSKVHACRWGNWDIGKGYPGPSEMLCSRGLQRCTVLQCGDKPPFGTAAEQNCCRRCRAQQPLSGEPSSDLAAGSWA